MYIAPRKYPGSRSNSNSQTGQRKCILGKPRKIERRKIVPRRQRGHRWASMSCKVSHAPLLVATDPYVIASHSLLMDSFPASYGCLARRLAATFEVVVLGKAS